VDYPTIQVNAAVPGASPETMASTVATPLEREFSTIAGIQSMNSNNTLGSTAITVQFSLERKIDEAAQDIQAAIARAGGRLPPSMPRPPTYNKVTPAEQPVFYLALDSTTMPMYQVNEYADTLLAQRISMVSGVSRVQVFGAQKYAVRVQVDPDKLAARGIGIDEVQRAIDSSNTNLPTGRLDGDTQAYTIESSGSLATAPAYRPIVVAWRNGTAVRLEELGNVIDSVDNDKIMAWYNNRRAVILAIQRQPGTNTVDVVDGVAACRSSEAHPAGGDPCASLTRRNRSAPDSRCRVHTGAHHLRRRAGDLPVPAQSLGDPDSRLRGAVFDCRHLRRDVPAGVQFEQPLPDGADAFRGIRRG
jgi:HAE1 family hydrophobic/amphiphilic exporter-1